MASLLGIVLTGLIAGTVLKPAGHPTPTGPAQTIGAARPLAVSMVAPDDLPQAASTLSPGGEAQLLADAKSCRAPLAVMTLSKAAGAEGGIIRIRSGAYLSPAFQVSDAPQRIAIPLPAPYATGNGMLSVEGAATGVELTLYPTWTAPNLAGKGLINLLWPTDKPCGK